MYAEKQFWLHGKAEEQTVSRLKNLQQVEKTLKRKPKELQNLPVLAEELQYLWALYVEINNGSDGRITWKDLHAYCELMGELSPFEIEVIRNLNELHQRS